MMQLNASRMRTVAAALALGSLAVASACTPDEQSPLGSNPAPSPLKVGLEVSSAVARPGDRLVVAVHTELAGGATIQGLQGYVRYNPAALDYAGQPAGSTSLVLVNDQAAARGELRVLAVETKGLGARPVTLEFQVKRADYGNGLRFDLEAAADHDTEIRRAEAIRGLIPAADLAVPTASERLDADGWMRRLAPREYAVEFGGPQTYSPGQYLTNLLYGNVTRDAANAINVLDVVATANASVGFTALIDSTSKDVVIAGNVRPVNGGVGGTPRPGVEPANASAPDGQINVTDVVAIANAAAQLCVGQTVVCAVIPGRQPQTTNRVIINADITSDRLFSKDTIYQIGDPTKGTIVVTNGATLTIQAGTRVEGWYGTQVYTGGIGSGQGDLVIARDGRIVAQGTALEPILMTCVLPTLPGPLGQAAGTRWPGCWGGLFIHGNATINADSPTSAALGPSPAVGSGATQRSAGGCIQEADEFSGIPFGGCNDADSSGVLQYVISAYGGARFTPTKERNGITFNGVGSGTLVDHIQAHASLDDGTEYFGGTVNIKYAYASGNEDDNFDWVLGYRGKMQFLLQQSDSTNGDRCMEMDNNGIDGGNADALPRSNPTVYNVTCVGKRDAVRYSAVTGLPVTCATQLSSSAVPGANCVNQAFEFRQNTDATVRNVVVYRFGVGLDIDGLSAQTTGGAAAGICSSSGFPFLKSAVMALSSASLPPGTSGGVSVGGDPDGSDPNTAGVCGAYTTSGSDLEAQIIADPNNKITVFAGGDVNGDFLVDPLNVIAPDFRPKAGSAPADPTRVTPVPADPFFTAVSYLGAVAPQGATANIPWYSGWTVGYVSATGGPFAGWPQK